MRLLRGLHPDAHMRPLGVVEADDALKLEPAFFSGGYGHLIQPFGLQDAVGALRHSVLEGIAALGHTDADTMALQFRHIRVTAVLAAPVGMVDETPGSHVVYVRKRHTQCLKRICRLQCGADSPANDLVRVSVGYQ